MKKIITILAIALTITTTKAQSPCDSIWNPINYSTASHTFCATGTYELNQTQFNWVTITGQYANPNTYNFSVNGGPFTNTPSITFTPSAAGITTFVITGATTQSNTVCTQTITWTFTTVVCQYTNTANGIEEYDQFDESGPAVYYDLTGNIIEKRYNELIIIRQGRRIKKVYYQN